MFTGIRSSLVPRLARGHSVTSIPVNKECHLVSFPLSGLIGANVDGINVVAGRGCRSLVSRLNSNGT